MKANLGKTCERKQNSGDRQARLEKVEWVSLKGDFEQRRTGWGETENRPACFECGNTDRFKAQFRILAIKEREKRWTNVIPTTGKGGGTKRANPTDGKGKGVIDVSFRKPSGNDTVAGEVSGGQVNFATAQVNLSDILGEDAWGNKNRPKECSSIIDAGFNGGGLRSFARMRKYPEYLRSAHPNGTW